MNKAAKEPLDDTTTIDMELVSQKSVDHWLKKFKLWDGSTKHSLLQKVLILESFFARVFDPIHFEAHPELADKAITCEPGEDPDEEPGCGGEFYEGMPCCPFCTHSESEDHNQKTDDEIAEYLLKIEGMKVRAAGKVPPSAIVPVPKEDKPKAQPLPKSDLGGEVSMEEMDIVPAQTNGVIATVEELDAAIQRAVDTYSAMVSNYSAMVNHGYECAVEIKEIHDRQLWRQRRGSDEQPKYKNFSKFVEEELAPRGITRKNAYALMDQAKKFSRDQFEALGPAKMNVLLSLEGPEREALAQETIEKGLPVSKVKEKKEQIKPSRGGGSKGPKASPKPSTIKAEKLAEKDQVFTMVFPASTFSADMHSTKGGPKPGKPKLAKSLDDLPMVEIEGANGMKLRLCITQGKDGRIQVAGFLNRGS